MIIASRTKSTVANSEGRVFVILPGRHSYRDLDHKDPKVAEQLRIMRDEVCTISFNEILEGDDEHFDNANKTPGRARKDYGGGGSGGGVSGKGENEGTARKPLSKRGDGNDKARKVRRGRPKKKQAVAKGGKGGDK